MKSTPDGWDFRSEWYARRRNREEGRGATKRIRRRQNAVRALAMPPWPPLDMSAGDVSIYHRGTTFPEHPNAPPRSSLLPLRPRVPTNLLRVLIGILLIHTASRCTRVDERGCTRRQSSLICRQPPHDAERPSNSPCKSKSVWCITIPGAEQVEECSGDD